MPVWARYSFNYYEFNYAVVPFGNKTLLIYFNGSIDGFDIIFDNEFVILLNGF